MAYSEWAIALTEHFFGLHAEERRVRLMVDSSFFDREFSHLGGFQGFIIDINDGPECLPREWRLNCKAQRLYQQWPLGTNSHPDYPSLDAYDNAPPYIPYLCLLCLAWTIEVPDGVTGNAFYPRLKKLLQDGNTLTAQELPKWRRLWDGLEDWTRRLKGKRGLFRVETLGEMGHVGIPKSQVVLPPHKLAHLPDIFWHSHLRCGQNYASEELRNYLIQDKAFLNFHLGQQLCTEIVDGTSIGNAAVDIMLEVFKEWDGKRSGTMSSESGVSRRSVILKLVLSYLSNGWCDYVGMVDEDIDGAILEMNNGSRLRVRNHGRRLCVLESDNGCLIHPFANAFFGEGSFDAKGLVTDDDMGEREFVAKWKVLSIFALRVIGDRDLVETDCLPTAGPCYFCIAINNQSDWDRWVGKYEVESLLTEIPQTGLPVELRLVCIKQIETLSDDARKKIPIEGLANNRKPSFFQLVEGTRVRAGGLRKTYADFDLPRLVMNQDGVEPICEGCMLKEITDRNPNNQGTMHAPLKEYELMLNQDAGIVRIAASDQMSNRQEECFGVLQNGGGLSGEHFTRSIHIDRFGWPTRGGSGLRGIEISGENPGVSKCEFPENIEWNNHSEFSEVVFLPKMEFVASLALTGSPISVSEGKRRAFSINGVGWNVFKRELLYLRDLGYIEMPVDDQGRWLQIVPNRPFMCLMPWKRSGRYVAALLGCYRSDQLGELLGRAKNDLECKVWQSPAKQHSIIPATIYIANKELVAFELLVEAFPEWCWSATPPAWLLCNWSPDLDEWLESEKRWMEGPGKTTIAGEYNPLFFRIVKTEPFHAPTRLQFLEDTVTGVHRIFKLIGKDPRNFNTHHCFIRDPAWAKWKCQNACAAGEWRTGQYSRNEGDCTPVLCSSNKNQVYLPRELKLPYVLSRALTLCSGIPPKDMDIPNPYTDLLGDYARVDREGGYHDIALCYEGVPPFFAKGLFNKLWGIPIKRENLVLSH